MPGEGVDVALGELEEGRDLGEGEEEPVSFLARRRLGGGRRDRGCGQGRQDGGDLHQERGPTFSSQAHSLLGAYSHVF